MKRFLVWLFDYPQPKDPRIDAIMLRQDVMEKALADFQAATKEQIEEVKQRFEDMPSSNRPGRRMSFAQMRHAAEQGAAKGYGPQN